MSTDDRDAQIAMDEAARVDAGALRESAPDIPGSSEPKAARLIDRIENGVNLVAILLLGLMPVLEIVTRTIFRGGVQDSIIFVRSSVVLVGYLGAMLAAREKQHLSVAVATFFKLGHTRTALETVSYVMATLFSTAFTVTAVEWWLTAFGAGELVWFVPLRLFAVIVPVSFTIMTVRFFRSVPRVTYARVLAVVAVVLGLILSVGSISNMAYNFMAEIPDFILNLETFWFDFMRFAYIPLLITLILSSFVGTPLFVVITGVAYLLVGQNLGFLAVIPDEGYSMLKSSSIPAIPMFTFVGYVLSESKAGERLFRLFKALLGWMPGGMVVASILVSVFFATFTGASGVVILALGGLLYTILHVKGRQSERFTVGLLTGVGDLGLLFAPSLVLILYATTAQISVIDMFLGGLLPGLVTVAVFCVVGVIVSIRRREERYKFEVKEALQALGGSIWEVLLPVIIVVGYFTGITTLVETGAVALLYVVIVEVFVLKELSFRDLLRAGTKSAMIMGGVLVILAGAKALSYYVVQIRLPFILIEWVEANIGSKLVFLLLLNLALLATGMFMDIFSAVTVVVPLILPLGALFGIDPVHLGVIFVANMALGFITPPVGLELFLASYRFGQPLPVIYRYIIPFFLLQLGAVLIITYVPWFSTALVDLIGPLLTPS